MSTFEAANFPKLNRRQSLRLGAATAAVGVLTSKELATSTQAATATITPPFTTPFAVALPVYTAKTPVSGLSPPPTQDANTSGGECGRPSHQRETEFPSQKYYEMHAKEAWHSFHPELPVQKIWGYDARLPGPTFVERYGVPITVRIYNDLPAQSIGFGSPEISTHLHNLHSGSESDGFTGDYYSATKYGPTMTASGAYKDHHYPNIYAGYDNPLYAATKGDPREALGTLWYHDHRLDFTGPNVYKGLTGFYLLFDDIDSGNELDTNPKALRLPSGVGKYDIPLVFQDKFFDSSGYLAYDQFNTDGILGNKFCVNGKVQPKFSVERRKYRFRLLDGGPSRVYEFYLTDASGINISFTHISNDGNLFPAPLTTKKVMLGVAERGDIILDFAGYPLGTKLYLVNRMIQTNGRGPDNGARDANGLLLTAGTQLLRFDIDRDPPVPDQSRVPALLRELPPIDLNEVVTTRNFVFGLTNGGWTVNGNLFDVNVATAQPKRGTAEIWVLKGSGNWHHPVHIHFEEGRILSRNGQPPAPHEAGRKDVYLLQPNDEVRVFLRFREFQGKYMMHCHNLIHEDHAMMIRWDIVP
ncbi:multicopper oxidase domain-containing protein [Polaromonas sp.]|uniref:multicopper oxidase family protein n=1 Tax=Polaromonas sp. TaxID=1869339 RepID=UPI00286BA2AD|nr:multicopper oxidase domain-containing protein [Polaromonas sp.]